MKKFEYLIRTNIDTFDFPENELNKLGNDGWELVGFQIDEGFSTHKGKYIFKRDLTPPSGA